MRTLKEHILLEKKSDMDSTDFKCEQIMFSNKDGVQSIPTLADLV